MWTTQVLSKTEAAIANVESAMREVTIEDSECIYADLLVTLARLTQIRRTVQRLDREDTHGS